MYLADLEADPQGQAPPSQDSWATQGVEPVTVAPPAQAQPPPAAQADPWEGPGVTMVKPTNAGTQGMNGAMVQDKPGGEWKWVEAEEDGPMAMAKAIGREINPVAFVKGVAQQAWDIPSALADVALNLFGVDVPAFDNPRQRINQVFVAQRQLAVDAGNAYRAGDMPLFARKTAEYFVPLLGPKLDQIADKLVAKKYWEASGEAIGLTLTSVVAPKLLSKVPVRVPGVFRNKNWQESQAAESAAMHDVRLSAGEASNNAFVKGAEEIVDYTPGGAIIAGGAKAKQTAGFEAWGRELADRVSPAPATAESAGEAAHAGTQAMIQRANRLQDTSYGKFRKIEADPTNTASVQVGTKDVQVQVPDPTYANTPFANDPRKVITVTKQVPVMETMQAPVRLANVKSNPALRATYDSIRNGPNYAIAQMDPGFRALEWLMTKARDFEPASYVDQLVLSPLKKLQRGSTIPELQSASQGLAGAAIRELEKEFQQVVAKMGPEAEAALTVGRAATIAKRTAEKTVFNALRNRTTGLPKEGVSIFKALTADGDTNIGQLRRVAQTAPDSIPQIARAKLEEIVSKATEAGETSRAAGAWRDWSNMGQQTRRLLYDIHEPDINAFFLSAKMAARVRAKSGTPLVATIANGTQFAIIINHPYLGTPVYIGYNMLPALLRAPRVVRLLTKGMNTPITDAGAAALTTELLKVAAEANQADQQKQQPPAAPPNK